ncbi:MAG: TlpA family protein disulfide reductase [Acidobacteria bacterium]|nr:TlpA family protein disulfide reductase [Acidobacteriota bacterium]
MIRALLLAAAFSLALPAADLPRSAGTLEFISHTGEKVRIQDLKGKVVAIEFLLTHCPGCKNGARTLAKLQSEYKAKGLQVVGLAIDQGAGPKIPQFIAETGANFPIGVYDHDKAQAYLQVPIMIRWMMPTVAFIDRKGMIREQYLGDDPYMSPAMEEINFRKSIEKLLAEGAPRPAAAPAKASPKK